MKRCYTCHEMKDMTEFWKNKSRQDGHEHHCRSCESHRKKQIRIIKNAAVRQYNREYLKKYRRAQREKFTEYDRQRNKEHVSAREELHDAVRTGKISKPSNCEECYSLASLEAHHNDYKLSLDVAWLCRECHQKKRVYNRTVT